VSDVPNSPVDQPQPPAAPPSGAALPAPLGQGLSQAPATLDEAPLAHATRLSTQAKAEEPSAVETGQPTADPSVPLAAPEGGAPLLPVPGAEIPDLSPETPVTTDHLLPEADATSAAGGGAAGGSAVEEEEEEEEEVERTTGAGPLELAEPDATDVAKEWYILKVQSNRENSIADTLRRRVKIAGLEDYFDEIIVPTEDIAEYREGKRKITKRKIYPGYIVVHMAITDETWFLVRDTPGVGDFTGAGGKPTPMLPKEVERILPKPAVKPGDMVKTTIPFRPGDRVRIKDGTFENFEGDVHTIDEANGRVTVMINIFGRSTPTELEHWQIEEV
jgi:transcriptional antiterminator NusG